jgi:hypothetical protein
MTTIEGSLSTGLDTLEIIAPLQYATPSYHNM